MAYNPLTGQFTEDKPKSNFTFNAGNPLADIGFQNAAKNAAMPDPQIAIDAENARLDAEAAAADKALMDSVNNQPVRTIINSRQNADGTFTILYSDGTTSISGTPTPTPAKTGVKIGRAHV
jgi:hypothetical protein